jgi:polar amino acid transport system substrate-binding protein
MDTKITRRTVLAGLSLPLLIRPSFAQQAVTLEQLKSAGVIRVGLVNQPPYSGLNPDGSIGGFVPTLTQKIMEKLGVPKIEPYVATYGELIPGLQAGRWQMIAAAFCLTKERCGQVAANTPTPPKTIKELAAGEGMIGVLQGSYIIKLATEQGIPENRLSQFPNNPAIIDGLTTGRVTAAISTNAAFRQLQTQRGGFDIVYPLSEDPPVGSAPAFALGDTELLNAFQTELRAMYKSGEVVAMAKEFGFDPAPANLEGITSEKACAAL